MIYDIIIVGSGPAGISLALKLSSDFGAKILLIESGAESPDSKIQVLSKTRAQGDLPASHFSKHSQRLIGGTSSLWAGWSTMMEKRAFNLGGWPISYDELAAYYPAAAKVIDLPDASYKNPSNHLGNSGLVFKPFYLSPPTRFKQKFLQKIREDRNIRFLTNTTCLKLNREKNRIVSVVVADSYGESKPELFKSSVTLLACGGLGNARLLMLSGYNEYPALGKTFMEHPHIYNSGEIVLDYEAVAELVSSRATTSKKIKPAFQFSDEFCISEKVPNFSIEFNVTEPSLMNLFGKRKFGFVSPSSIRGEMLPNFENKFVLTNKQDRFRQKTGKLDFAFHYDDMAAKCWDLFSEQLIRSGYGRAGVFAGSTQKIHGGGHLMGTTRMGKEIEDSVVDSNCKVHQTENLYIVGSSIFPYCGAANPTWTIIALAKRLADHVGKKLI